MGAQYHFGNRMKNAEKYSFKDFTHESYRELIEALLKKSYNFISYSQCQSAKEPWVLWRHDLDFSPQRALKLAQIEKEMGVKSTYFLLAHSRFYNLFERENVEIIKEIRTLGHDLALHFDFAFYDIDSIENLEKAIEPEKIFLEAVFEIEIEAFSFHNPNDWALNLKEFKLSGLINTYAPFFREGVAYASDSNGHWRNDSIMKRINENHLKLQILTHPVWWTEMLTSPKERVWSAIEGRAQANKDKQLEHWKQWGRELPDW